MLEIWIDDFYTIFERCSHSKIHETCNPLKECEPSSTTRELQWDFLAAFNCLLKASHVDCPHPAPGAANTAACSLLVRSCALPHLIALDALPTATAV